MVGYFSSLTVAMAFLLFGVVCAGESLPQQLQGMNFQSSEATLGRCCNSLVGLRSENLQFRRDRGSFASACGSQRTSSLSSVNSLESVSQEFYTLAAAFNLGKLNVASKTPSSRDKNFRSSSWPIFDFGQNARVKVVTGIHYSSRLQKKGNFNEDAGLCYLEAVQRIKSRKWNPYVALSYVRSLGNGEQANNFRGMGRSAFLGIADRVVNPTLSNVEVLGTRWGVMPRPNLSLTFSYSYLNKVDGESVVNKYSNSSLFSDVRLGRGQEFDFNVDYQYRPGANLAVKSGYFLKGKSFLKSKPIDDEIVVIEGSITVSF